MDAPNATLDIAAIEERVAVAESFGVSMQFTKDFRMLIARVRELEAALVCVVADLREDGHGCDDAMQAAYDAGEYYGCATCRAALCAQHALAATEATDA